MAEYIDWFFNGDDIGHTILARVFGLIGLTAYIFNWIRLIMKMRPGYETLTLYPAGAGLFIAVSILMFHGGWWALVGLTDAKVVYIILYLFFYDPRAYNANNNNNGDTEENGEHDD